MSHVQGSRGIERIQNHPVETFLLDFISWTKELENPVNLSKDFPCKKFSGRQKLSVFDAFIL
jgi:hypothetical protein